MAVNTSKNYNNYKREIDKQILSPSINDNNTIDQPITSEKVNPHERYTNESEKQGKSESTKDKISRNASEFIGGRKNEDQGSSFAIKPVIFGLFALIGFIIFVYSIFVAVVGEPLVSITDTVFVAVLIGSFTLVGIIVNPLFLKK